MIDPVMRPCISICSAVVKLKKVTVDHERDRHRQIRTGVQIQIAALDHFIELNDVRIGSGDNHEIRVRASIQRSSQSIEGFRATCNFASAENRAVFRKRLILDMDGGDARSFQSAYRALHILSTPPKPGSMSATIGIEIAAEIRGT